MAHKLTGTKGLRNRARVAWHALRGHPVAYRLTIEEGQLNVTHGIVTECLITANNVAANNAVEYQLIRRFGRRGQTW